MLLTPFAYVIPSVPRVSSYTGNHQITAYPFSCYTLTALSGFGMQLILGLNLKRSQVGYSTDALDAHRGWQRDANTSGTLACTLGAVQLLIRQAGFFNGRGT